MSNAELTIEVLFICENCDEITKMRTRKVFCDLDQSQSPRPVLGATQIMLARATKHLFSRLCQTCIEEADAKYEAEYE